MTTSRAKDEPSGSAIALWSDNGASIDFLRFGYLAAGDAGVVTTKHLLPVTVGISGDGDGGKSTPIRRVQDPLAQRPGTMVVPSGDRSVDG